MRALCRQLLTVLMYTAGIYALLYVGSHYFYPATASASVNVYEANPSQLWATEPEFVVYRLAEMDASPKKRLVVIGSSSALDAYHPDALKQVLPGYEHHNLAVSASNITQCRQVVEMYANVVGPESMQETVFVLGLFYGLLGENKVMWSDGQTTAFDAQALRYGLFQRTADGSIAPTVKYRNLSRAVPLWRPVLFTARVVEHFKHRFECAKGFTRTLTADRKLDWDTLAQPIFVEPIDGTMVGTPEKIERNINFYKRFLSSPDGVLQREQLDELKELCDWISTMGARVVIVEMPLPSWHREPSPHSHYYDEHCRGFVMGLAGQPDVDYVDMQSVIADEMFRDGVHPVTKDAVAWSASLAERIKPLLP